MAVEKGALARVLAEIQSAQLPCRDRKSLQRQAVLAALGFCASDSQSGCVCGGGAVRPECRAEDELEAALARIKTIGCLPGRIKVEHGKTWLRERGPRGVAAASLLGKLSGGRNHQCHRVGAQLLAELELLAADACTGGLERQPQARGGAAADEEKKLLPGSRDDAASGVGDVAGGSDCSDVAVDSGSDCSLPKGATSFHIGITSIGEQTENVATVALDVSCQQEADVAAGSGVSRKESNFIGKLRRVFDAKGDCSSADFSWMPKSSFDEGMVMQTTSHLPTPDQIERSSAGDGSSDGFSIPATLPWADQCDSTDDEPVGESLGHDGDDTGGCGSGNKPAGADFSVMKEEELIDMKVLEEANSDEVKPALGTTCSAFVKVKSRRNIKQKKGLGTAIQVRAQQKHGADWVLALMQEHGLEQSGIETMAGAMIGDTIIGRCGDGSKFLAVVADFGESGEVLVRRLVKADWMGLNVAKDAIIDGMGDVCERLTPSSDVKSSGAAYEALDRLIRAGGMGLSSTAWYENELRQLACRFDELDKRAKP